MKVYLQLVMTILFMVPISTGKLLPCAETMQEVCFQGQNYISTNSPEPFPTMINLRLKVFEVMGVDEGQQTMSLSMMAVVDWQDFRLDVNRSKDYIERYYSAN